METVRILPRAAAAVAVVCGVALVGAGVTAATNPPERAPLRTAQEVVIEPDAGAFPALSVPASTGEVQVVVSGSWRFAHTGEDLGAGALIGGVELPGVGERPLVRVQPRPTHVEADGDRATLTYESLRAGRTVTLTPDTDPLVDAFLIAPAVARASLSGQLDAAILHRPAPASPWTAAAAPIGGGVLLLLAGAVPLGLEARRRRNTRVRRLQREIAARIARLGGRLRDGDEASAYLTRVLAASGRAADALAADLARHRHVAGDDHPALAGLQRIADVVRELEEQVHARAVERSGRDVDAALQVADVARDELAAAARSGAAAADELDRLEDLHRPRPRAAERSPS